MKAEQFKVATQFTVITLFSFFNHLQVVLSVP
jgi:hypothetical protein